MISTIRRFAGLGIFTLAVALLVPTGAPASATPAGPFPNRIELPDGFRPEGIAAGRGPTAFLGSLANGDIYRVNLRTGAGKVISEGTGAPSVGMKADRRGRLFVAGGNGGDARVIDTRSGDVLASYQLTTDPSFVNDVVLTRHAAWFTDSTNAQLYRVPLTRHGGLPDAAAVQTVPLTGEWVQGEGFGANGIAQTPDRRSLLVVNSTSGVLYRVDPRTGAATQVDLGEADLTNGDGLLRKGRTLFAVLNQQNRVAVVTLNRAGTEGRVTSDITSPDFDVPTTVARFGHHLYLPNARFTTPPTPTTPYWITRVRAR